MRKSYKIGRIRIELAKILTDYCGVYIAPALLTENRDDFWNSRNLGYAYSWFADVSIDHPLYDYGSALTMSEFVRLSRKGWKIKTAKRELFLEPEGID